MITNKKHNRIVKDITNEYQIIIEKLREELRNAKDLKVILEKIYPILTVSNNLRIDTFGGNYNVSLGDDVLVYVDDILGGKVVKQEGTRCLVINEKGEVQTGLTKQKSDKGYKYKLIRK